MRAFSTAIAVTAVTGLTTGCATTEPSADSSDAYRATLARSLGYYEGTEKRYLISAPWRALNGRISVCVREELDDGRGNKIGGGQMNVYLLDHGRITESISDNNCIYRDYSALQPVKR